MAIDILTWIFLTGMCGMAVIVVYLIVMYINPVRNSPAKYFIRAKRNKKPLAILDNGNYWTFSVGQTEIDGGFIGEDGSHIIETPGSIKWGYGVRFGVGDGYRGLLINPKILKILGMAHEAKIEPRLLRALIERLDEIQKIAEDQEFAKKTNEETKKNIEEVEDVRTQDADPGANRKTE